MTTLTPENARTSFGGLQVIRASDIEYGFCGAIYGQAGTGKTTLAATAADTELGAPLAILDAEGGASVVAHRSDIDIVPMGKWSDFEDFRKTVSKDCPWKTLVFDNMSEINTMRQRSLASDGMLTIQQHGKVTADMLDMVRFYRDLSRFRGINVIFIAWETSVKNESGGEIKRGVKFTPALAEAFPGIVDFVGYLKVEPKLPNWGRILDLSPNPRLDSKFRRSGNSAAMQIPFQIPNPSLADIIDTVKGGKPWPKDKYDLERMLKKGA